MEVAVAGRADGAATLLVTRDPALSSLRELDEEVFDELLGHMRDYPAWRRARTLVERREVPVVSLDAWARRKGLERVDLLSVRMPGTALEALSGAATLLAEGRVSVVRTGMALRPFYRGEAPFAEVDEVLTSRGYAFVDGRYPWRAIGHVRRDGAGAWGEGPRYTAAGVATYVHGSCLDGTIADIRDAVSAALVLAQLGFGSTAAAVLDAHPDWPRERTDAWLDTWARPTTRERRLAWLARWLPPFVLGR